MDQPVILAVDDDPADLAAIERELDERYARHYRVVCVSSSAEARRHLTEIEAAGESVAVVLAGQALDDGTV